MDVRNDPQQETNPQAVSSSNLLMGIRGVISFHSSKKSPVKEDNQCLSTKVVHILLRQCYATKRSFIMCLRSAPLAMLVSNTFGKIHS
jgi:hypothetical protein